MVTRMRKCYDHTDQPFAGIELTPAAVFAVCRQLFAEQPGITEIDVAAPHARFCVLRDSGGVFFDIEQPGMATRPPLSTWAKRRTAWPDDGSAGDDGAAGGGRNRRRRR